MGSHRAWLRVSVKLLEEALGLPDGCHIAGVIPIDREETVKFLVRGAPAPFVESKCDTPDAEAIVETVSCESRGVIREFRVITPTAVSSES